MTLVYLVRHAAHDRVDAVLCGRMPGVTLGAKGHAEAAAAAARLAGCGAEAVLTSPMERARETAAPIAAALGLTPELAPELNEIDFGDWTGLRFDALASDPVWQTWNRDRTNGRAPGGERMTDVQERIGALIKCLGAGDRAPVILVSHGDVIRAAVLAVLGLPLDAYHRIDIDPASISTLSVWQGGAKVVGLNERVAHGLSGGTKADAGRHAT